MRLTVLSGKGGVGKSMLASSFAILLSKRMNVIAIDCDVDAPNLALWLGTDVSKPDRSVVSKKISTVEKPVIDTAKCTGCGTCIQNCSFGALVRDDSRRVMLVPYRCEGCGLCEIVCPSKAITMEKVENCLLTQSTTAYGFSVIQGQIEPGEAESGEAVTEIRKYAQTLSSRDTLFVQDAAAGIGCPVIASIVGSDYVVGVAEPSESSFSDLKRALQVVTSFKIPYGVVVNKCDLNEQVTDEIKSFAGDHYLGSVRYDSEIVRSVVNLTPPIETCEPFYDVIGNEVLFAMLGLIFSHLVSYG